MSFSDLNPDSFKLNVLMFMAMTLLIFDESVTFPFQQHQAKASAPHTLDERCSSIRINIFSSAIGVCVRTVNYQYEESKAPNSVGIRGEGFVFKLKVASSICILTYVIHMPLQEYNE